MRNYILTLILSFFLLGWTWGSNFNEGDLNMGSNSIDGHAVDGLNFDPDSDGLNEIIFNTDGTITLENVTYTATDGSANEVLITNGFGTTSFTSLSGLETDPTLTDDNDVTIGDGDGLESDFTNLTFDGDSGIDGVLSYDDGEDEFGFNTRAKISVDINSINYGLIVENTSTGILAQAPVNVISDNASGLIQATSQAYFLSNLQDKVLLNSAVGTGLALTTAGVGSDIEMYIEGYGTAQRRATWDATGLTFDSASYQIGGIENQNLLDKSATETISGTYTFSNDVTVPTEIYGVGWNGSNEVPTKDAVYDKIETISPSLALNDLTDVDTTGVASGDFIQYNGSNWVDFDLLATANAWTATQTVQDVAFDGNGTREIGTGSNGIQLLHIGNDITASGGIADFRGLKYTSTGGGADVEDVDFYVGADNVFAGYYAQRSIVAGSTSSSNADDYTNLYQGGPTYEYVGLMYEIEDNGSNGVSIGDAATDPVPLYFGPISAYLRFDYDNTNSKFIVENDANMKGGEGPSTFEFDLTSSSLQPVVRPGVNDTVMLGDYTNSLAWEEVYADDYRSGNGNLGITDNTSYWLCTASDCSTTCQVDIEDGLIVGCP